MMTGPSMVRRNSARALWSDGSRYTSATLPGGVRSSDSGGAVEQFPGGVGVTGVAGRLLDEMQDHPPQVDAAMPGVMTGVTEVGSAHGPVGTGRRSR